MHGDVAGAESFSLNCGIWARPSIFKHLKLTDWTIWFFIVCRRIRGENCFHPCPKRDLLLREVFPCPRAASLTGSGSWCSDRLPGRSCTQCSPGAEHVLPVHLLMAFLLSLTIFKPASQSFAVKKSIFHGRPCLHFYSATYSAILQASCVVATRFWTASEFNLVLVPEFTEPAL